MKRILVVAAFVGLLGNWVGAQSNWEETTTRPAQPPHYGSHNDLFTPLRGTRDHGMGLFPVNGKDGKANMAWFLPENFLFSGRGHRAHGFRTDHFSLFGDRGGRFRGHRNGGYGDGGYFYGGYPALPGYGYYPMFDSGDPYGAKPALYDSQRFVDEWKDRDPAQLSESRKPSLSESILLKEGMSEEQVIQAVGAPLQKVQMGDRTVWKYSGYSLLFEGGTLKDIR